MDRLYEITERAISVDQVVARLADPAIGAVATFVGVVRGETSDACIGTMPIRDGRETRYLEYEA